MPTTGRSGCRSSPRASNSSTRPRAFCSEADDPVVGDGNRVTVFVMPTAKDVQKLVGDSFVAGFYTGRVSGPLAYVAIALTIPISAPTTILFHEYAHHLMMQQLDQPYPEWYVEGFAEFLSVPEFEQKRLDRDRRAAADRGWAFSMAKPLPIDEMLGETYGEITKLRPSRLRESVYGRGWLLTHYLTMESNAQRPVRSLHSRDRPGVDGRSPSARASFGDLNQLDKELNAYLRRNETVGSKIGADRIHPAPVEVLPLTEGAAAVVLLRGRIKYELKQAEARQALDQVRAIAARYPGDVLVERLPALGVLQPVFDPAAEHHDRRRIKYGLKAAERLEIRMIISQYISRPGAHDVHAQQRSRTTRRQPSEAPRSHRVTRRLVPRAASLRGSAFSAGARRMTSA